MSNSSSGVADLPHILLVTGNKGKLFEIQKILQGVAVVENIALDLPELQGASALEISKEKGREAFRLLRRPVLIEDTSLCFNGLNGLPGPYIKWFFDKLSCDGLVKMLDGFEDKSAYASCIFTYCTGPDDVRSFEGRCHGSIVKPRGVTGFGWDPIFQPSEELSASLVDASSPTNEILKKTFAEMTGEEKNRISHRAKALALVKEFFLGADETANPSPAKKLRSEVGFPKLS
jgi:inosine triphosphate pyrophosphatase